MIKFTAALVFSLSVAAAQEPQPTLADIVRELKEIRLENQRLNRAVENLQAEVRQLRGPNTATAAAAPPVEERVDVLNQRVEDLTNSKVEAGEHFPLKITGVALMNVYRDTGQTGGADLPMVATTNSAQSATGGTFRNSQIAFEYSGSRAIFGAEVQGKLQLDFFGGSLNIQNHLARIRTANIGLHWQHRSLVFAVDKPIFSPRDPDSLSQLGIPLLANAGNLWLWQPQLRYEERWNLSETSGIRARIGVYQTNETLAALPAARGLEASRPALQGRIEYFRVLAGGRRLEIAPGFHVSRSILPGAGVESYAVSTDWLVPVAPKLDWTGFAFTGQNLAGLGIAAIHQSINFRGNQPFAVRGRGGWTTLTLHAAPRLDINGLAGLQDDANRDLSPDGIARNLAYGANLRWRIAPNVVLGPELLQIRTTYRQSGVKLIHRYDLAIAYLF